MTNKSVISRKEPTLLGHFVGRAKALKRVQVAGGSPSKTVQVVSRGRKTSVQVIANRPRPQPGRDETETKTLPPVLPFDNGLKEHVQRDTVTQIQLLKPRFEGGSPSLENLVYAYISASVLRSEPDEWQLFCMRPEWLSRRHRPDLSAESRNDALLHVVRYLCGTGAKASVPVKRIMKLLRPFWESQTKAYDLHCALTETASLEGKASIAVRFADGDVSRRLLAMSRPCVVTVRLALPAGKKRQSHLFDVREIIAEPL